MVKSSKVLLSLAVFGLFLILAGWWGWSQTWNLEKLLQKPTAMIAEVKLVDVKWTQALITVWMTIGNPNPVKATLDRLTQDFYFLENGHWLFLGRGSTENISIRDNWYTTVTTVTEPKKELATQALYGSLIHNHGVKMRINGTALISFTRTSFQVPFEAELKLAVGKGVRKDILFVKEATNPLLKVPMAWFDRQIGHPMVLKDKEIYYMYFHAGAVGANLRIGVATALSPTGPWSVSPSPALTETPGAWDNVYVATPYVLKFYDTYYMWYSGYDGATIRFGLAIAPSIDGPWRKYEGNPVFTFIGNTTNIRIGSVQFIVDTYYMWYGSENEIRLATAPEARGPWTDQGIVLTSGPLESWEASGVSGECGVIHFGNLFHMFYSGTSFANKTTVSEVGYSVSINGKNWIRYPLNPVIRRGKSGEWDDYRLSGINALLDRGVLYVYYTGIHYEPGAITPSTAIGLATIAIPF